MEYVTHRSKLNSDLLKIRVPKDFEYKVFGHVVLDLENHVRTKMYHSDTTDALLGDIASAKLAIRSRDPLTVCTLGDRLSTQSMLLSRPVSCVNDAEAFFLQQQLGCFLKKYPFKGVDTVAPAIQKFLKAERECANYNKFNYKALIRMDQTMDPIFGNILDSIREDIAKLLGHVPDTERVEVDALHGPGVSQGTGYDKGRSTSYYKWSNLPYTVTELAKPYAISAISNDPRWIGALDNWYRTRTDNMYGPIDTSDFWDRVLDTVSGSRITTVPKTAKVDRTIAIEPVMNVYLQLGVDRIIRKRLKRKWNIDLDTQDVNQHLAESGSIDGAYATIDLAAASDTISLKICELLLPPAWYNLLCDLRSPSGELIGVTRLFDKISSMGNGFTFALESLIFAAITRHVMRRLRNHGRIAVYGDDIIVPTPAARPLIECLQYCGFTTNIDKTFVSGPFRESCGTDWFLGYNVRPVFLTRKISTVLDLFYLHNALYQLEENLSWQWDIHFENARRYIRKYIPKKFGKIFGPPSETLDGYLFSRRRIPGVGLDRWHLTLGVTAKRFNHKTDFLFRKLMVPLKRTDSRIASWDRKRHLTTGNSFDVTRRDAVQIICTKRCVYL